MAGEGVLLVDPGAWVVRHIDGPGAEVLGVPAPQAVGRELDELLPPGRHGRLSVLLDAALTGAAPHVVREHHESLGGRWLEHRVLPVPGATVLVFADVTEEVRHREELAAARGIERERIARDIHDDTLQVLAGLGLRLDLLGERTDDPRMVEGLEEARGILRHAQQRLRSLVFDLRPPALRMRGVVSAIRSFLEYHDGDWSLEWSIDGALHPEPGEVAQGALYRITSEALGNAARHAGACTVTVRFDRRDDVCHVVVRDDGPGFDPEGYVHEGHIGLLVMRERAELAGGTLEVDSVPGRGTTVRAHIPA